MKNFIFIFIFIILSGSAAFSLDIGKEPSDLVIAIDTSKSVNNLPSIKKALELWVKNVLKDGDRVSIIKFANKPEKLGDFTVDSSNISEMINLLPDKPDKNGDFTDLSSAIMESLLLLTDYYHNPPDGEAGKRKQFLLMVSDFENDPPPESPYYEQNDIPYKKYKEAKDKCLQGYEPFKLMDVYFRAFSLKDTLDSLGTEGDGIDNWWQSFLSSLHSPPPTTPVPLETPVYEDIVPGKFKDEYKKDTSKLKIDIVAEDKNMDWGKVPREGITLKKSFRITNNHKVSLIKELVIKIFIGNLPVNVKCNAKGVKVKDNIISIDTIQPGGKIVFAADINIKNRGDKKGTVQENLNFKITGKTGISDNYKKKILSDIALTDEEMENAFLKKSLKDEKNFSPSLTYPEEFPLMAVIIAGVLILLIILIFVIFFIKKTLKPVNVSLKLGGLNPIIHSYELTSNGAIEIVGGTFITPDQFELPDVDGLVAYISRKGNKFFIFPEKCALVNSSGETENTKKEINFGDTFILRVERMSGGQGDFIFEFQKAGMTDSPEDELDSILEEEGYMTGKINTDDLL